MQLFITYSHQSLDEVKRIVEILTVGGHAVWFDDQLLPGQDWRQELGEKIERCDALVYALTTEAVASEWCQWEFATAVRLGKAIIPALLESNVSVPDSLKRFQYADFSQGATPIAVAKLFGALSTMQKIPVGESPSLPRDPKGFPSRAWKNAKHWTDFMVKDIYKPQDQEEELLGKFGADLYKGIRSIGGRLILTNRRVMFEPNSFNIGSKTLEIPIETIKKVFPSKLFGFIPTAMTIRCYSGEDYVFYVWRRKRIIGMIEQYQYSRKQ